MNIEGGSSLEVSSLKSQSADHGNGRVDPLCGDITLLELLGARSFDTHNIQEICKSSRRTGSAISCIASDAKVAESSKHWQTSRQCYAGDLEPPNGTVPEMDVVEEGIGLVSREKVLSSEDIFTKVTELPGTTGGRLNHRMKTGEWCGSEEHVKNHSRFHFQADCTTKASSKLPLLNDINFSKGVKETQSTRVYTKQDNTSLPTSCENELKNCPERIKVCVNGKGCKNLSQELSSLRPFLPQLTLSQCSDVDSAVIEVVRDHNDPHRGVARGIDSPFSY